MTADSPVATANRKDPTDVKSSLLKRGVRASACLGLASGFAATAALTTAPAAHAVVPAGQVVISAGGSDTTEKVMTAILTGTTTVSGTTVNLYNIPSQPGITGPATYTVPGDATGCVQDVGWKASLGAGEAPPAFQVAPNGSSAGRNYLATEQTAAAGQQGCIDVARSSGTPRTSTTGDKLTFEYYAFAMDAVSWGSPSLSAPSTMTKQQLKDIYACNITDWGQLPGGGSGPIQRYLPQSGSGTRAFFISDMLDNISIPASAANCPAIPTTTDTGGVIEENSGNAIRANDYQSAILPYSAGQWVFQANNKVNPTIDLRNGTKLGGITDTVFPTAATLNGNPVAWSPSDSAFQLNTGPSASNVVNEGNVKAVSASIAYPGIRYVYNVVDTASPSYTQAVGVVGFNNVGGGTKSSLCSNGKLSPILSFGFGPLSTSGNPTQQGSGGGATNVAGSTCRQLKVLS